MRAALRGVPTAGSRASGQRSRARAGGGSEVQVQGCIIGLGPAGLILLQHLRPRGIDMIVLEKRSPEHVLAQIDAEVVQQVTVDALDEAGVGSAAALISAGRVRKTMEVSATHLAAASRPVPACIERPRPGEDLTHTQLPKRFGRKPFAYLDIHSRAFCSVIADRAGGHGDAGTFSVMTVFLSPTRQDRCTMSSGAPSHVRILRRAWDRSANVRVPR